MLFDELRRHAEHARLRLVAVGYVPLEEVRGAPGHRGDPGGDHPAGAGFGEGERHLLLPEKPCEYTVHGVAVFGEKKFREALPHRSRRRLEKRRVGCRGPQDHVDLRVLHAVGKLHRGVAGQGPFQALRYGRLGNAEKSQGDPPPRRRKPFPQLREDRVGKHPLHLERDSGEEGDLRAPDANRETAGGAEWVRDQAAPARHKGLALVGRVQRPGDPFLEAGEMVEGLLRELERYPRGTGRRLRRVVVRGGAEPAGGDHRVT